MNATLHLNSRLFSPRLFFFPQAFFFPRLFGQNGVGELLGNLFFFFLPLCLLALLENVRLSVPFWKRSLSDVTEGTYTRIQPCLKSLSGASTWRQWCGSLSHAALLACFRCFWCLYGNCNNCTLWNCNKCMYALYIYSIWNIVIGVYHLWCLYIVSILCMCIISAVLRYIICKIC